jgi:phage terminase Nu1 subunit (DNA packaging protein)
MRHGSATGGCVIRSGLARIMGVSLPTIDNWLARGCPVISEPEPGEFDQYRFDTAAVIRWRIKDAVFADRRKYK